MSLRRLLPVPLLALALVPAAPAAADQAVAEIARQTPVAAYGGWEAWSRYDAASHRYTLVVAVPGQPAAPVGISTSSRPFDVSLGPDRDHNVAAVYQRCTSSGCDIRRYNTASGHDVKLTTVSSPSYDEATPAIWGANVVFTRRVHGCDVPYVKNLSSSAASRRLLKSKCLQTGPGHASIRGTRIVISSVDTSSADENGAGLKVAELRKYSATASGSQVMVKQSFGEESNYFGQVAQDDRFAYTVRVGIHQANTFMRVAYSGGKPEEARAFRTLTDAFAKPAANTSLYVESQGGEETSCDGFTDIPCRVVLAPALPFGGVQRTLTPQLTVAYEGQPRAGQPLPFSGTLTQEVVAGSSVVSTTPLAGVPVGLYHRAGSSPEHFDDTGLKTVTGADGTYRIVLPAAAGDPWYTAAAATAPVPTWAGRGTVGSVAP
ncbi:MAG TPA: hypothetical protein VF080_03050 [Solirubrobacteraceae bacterium]